MEKQTTSSTYRQAMTDLLSKSVQDLENLDEKERELVEFLQDEYRDIKKRAISLSKGNSYQPQEIIQESVLRALDKLDSFTFYNRGGTAKWFLKLMNNHFANLYRNRRRGRDQKREKRYDIKKTLNIENPTPTEEDKINRCEILDGRLVNLIDELPENHRRAFLLQALHDFSIEESAYILGCPEGTVMTWRYRAKNQMKRLIEEQKDLIEDTPYLKDLLL